MVSRWEDAFPSDQAVLLTVPQPEDIAISVAHKIVLLVAVIGLVLGVWALTSGPAARSQATDATLGPPMGANAHLVGSDRDSG